MREPARDDRGLAEQGRGICPACEGQQMLGRVEIPDHEYGLDYVATYDCCADCRTLFQRPMPTAEQLAAFYGPSYHSMSDGGFLMLLRHKMRIRRLQGLLGGGGGTVLDYGCGNGSFIRRAAEALPDVEFIGYEIGDEKEIVQRTDRVTIVRASLEDLLPLLPPCRVIIMNHVIEHLPDPFSVVSTLASKLEPGGYFDGQTPNAASFEHKIFGRSWSGFHAPRHTVVFSIAGLHRLFERSGVAAIRIAGAFNPAGYAVSLASLPHGHGRGNIPRHGLRWLLYVMSATAVLPLDVLSGAPGIVNFKARKQPKD